MGIPMLRHHGTLRAFRVAILLASALLSSCADSDGGRRSSSGTPPSVEIFGQSLPMPGERVSYVIDTSGSMFWEYGTYTDRFGNRITGTRLDFVRDRVVSSLQGLPDSAMFNLIGFSCPREQWAPSTQAASLANKNDAEAWLLGLLAWGGRSIGPAVAQALEEKENRTVILISLGTLNCGAGGTAGHLADIVNENTQGAAVHTFCLACSGGVPSQFMMDIATMTGGTYTEI